MSVVSSESFWNMTGILRERTEGRSEKKKERWEEGVRKKWGDKRGREEQKFCVFSCFTTLPTLMRAC